MIPATAADPLSGDTPTANISAQTLTQLLHRAPAAASKVLAALVTAQARHTLFLPDQPLLVPVLVAVSGGADSLCLLHALHQLAPHWRITLHVAHVDHALRPDSADDAHFVAALAQQLGLPFYHLRLDPGILHDAPDGLEAAARSARYAFLRHTANQIANQISTGENAGATVTITTAHHQDDQAETLLLHLIQGSGLAGLAGMAWVGELPDRQQPPLRLVRPLLGVSRAEIHAYLRDYALTWREDSSNQDLSHLRNQIRHSLLPLLATLNPNVHATLARSADLLAAEAKHAANRDLAAFSALTQTFTPSTRIALDWFRLAQLDRATRRGVLRHALHTLEIDLRDVGMESIDALLEQAQQPATSGPHPLISGWAWTRIQQVTGDSTGEGAMLAIHRADALPLVPPHPHLGAPLTTRLAIPLKGTLVHAGWHLQSTLLTPTDLPGDWRKPLPRGEQSWRLFCDAERCGDLYLTTYQPTVSPAMSIAPLGMGGHQSALGDIFTDHKIPPFLRAGWPVVVNEEGTTIWLCGLVIAEAVRVQQDTRQVRHLSWQRETHTA